MPGQTAGQENTAAGVTPAAPWRIRAVSVLPDHRLALTFRDGLSGITDFSAIRTSTNPGIYAPLASAEFFAQVRIELGVLIWPNGADLDPAWLNESLSADKTWSHPNGTKLRLFRASTASSAPCNYAVLSECETPNLVPFRSVPFSSFLLIFREDDIDHERLDSNPVHRNDPAVSYPVSQHRNDPAVSNPIN
jgi:hypothetical protein